MSARPITSGRGGACRIAVGGDSPVVKACENGGVAAAKKAMKKMLANGKTRGDKMFTCEGCHRDLDSYALVEGAREKFGKLLALQLQ